MARIRSVDVLRGFALLGMVVVHYVIYLGNDAAAHTWLYFTFNHLLGDWGAAAFLMLMGLSQVLSAARKSGSPEIVLFRKAALRSAYLFLVGLLMLGLAFGPHEIWQWDILTLMGLATLVLYGCRFLPSWLILVLSAAIALGTPWARGWVDPAASWGGAFVPTPVIADVFPGLFMDPAREYTVVWRLDAIVTGFLLTGTFPVFPWLSFPLIGCVLGRRIVGQRLQRDLWPLVVGGLLLTCLGLGGAFASLARPGVALASGYLVPLSFYPDSFTMMLCQLGIALVVFAALYYGYDVRGHDVPPVGQQGNARQDDAQRDDPQPDDPQRDRKDHPQDDRPVGFIAALCIRTSRYSLSFYFLHYQLIGWTLALVYLVTGRYRLGDLMGAWAALSSGLIALVFLEYLLALWDRHEGRYSLEWVLAVLTARLVRSPVAKPDATH